MGWRDLLQSQNKIETVVAPWLGGRELRMGPRRWTIEGRLPPEHGWQSFCVRGRVAMWAHVATHPLPPLLGRQRGIPIGDRFVVDGTFGWLGGVRGPDDLGRVEAELLQRAEPIHLLDPGIDRFQSVIAGRPFEGGPLVYVEMAMPEDAAEGVLRAWENGERSIAGIPGVTPALDWGFRLLWMQRDVAERARAESERLDRLRELDRAGVSAVGRRQLATVDFERAARAALSTGGAELLDSQPGARPTEKVVRFRTEGRRFECVCHALTLAVIDSGICLQDHATGRRDDQLLSLESLPSVIREAMRTGRLHVYRPVEPRGAYAAANAARDDWDEDTPL
jgi:hypothetical protein